MKTINYIGALIYLVAMILGWIWFGWELSLIIFLSVTGNNMERHNKKS